LKAALLGRRAAWALIAFPLIAAAQSPCGAPAPLADGWTVAAPAERAFDVDAFCRTLAQQHADANLHGIVVEQRGRLQFEAYFDGWDNPDGAWVPRRASFSPDELHDMRSVTKSITSLLVGVALEKGLLKDITTPAINFFPEHAALKTEARSRITLAHLLTMTAGLDWDESGSYARLGNSATQMKYSSDPDRYVLERDVVEPPGARFVYSSGATTLLGEVLARSTGMPLERFADEALFRPLGIVQTQWRRDRRDRVTPHGGLRLRPRDLAKIGRMVLDQGRWNGQQIVPARWIEESFRPRVPTGGTLQYGYQWWIGEARNRAGTFKWIAAMGNGGQRLFLVPELDVVVVITAGQYDKPDESWRAPLSVFHRVVAELAAKRAATASGVPAN
jgi:CubicO group peptidase (beta-lactamase class C family)